MSKRKPIVEMQGPEIYDEDEPDEIVIAGKKVEIPDDTEDDEDAADD